MTELVRWKHITARNVTTTKLVLKLQLKAKNLAGSGADKC